MGTINFFNILNSMRRHHGLFHLDPASRVLLDILTVREEAGVLTTAEDLIKSSNLNRATAYRKISGLTDEGIFLESWQDHRLFYCVGENVKKFCDEFREKFLQA